MMPPRLCSSSHIHVLGRADHRLGRRRCIVTMLSWRVVDKVSILSLFFLFLQVCDAGGIDDLNLGKHPRAAGKCWRESGRRCPAYTFQNFVTRDGVMDK